MLKHPLDRLLRTVSPLVSSTNTDVTSHIETGPRQYYRASWRIRNNSSRNLFIEQPGPVSPGLLRIGVYFKDALQLARPMAALAALRAHRHVLEPLGVRVTLTPGARTRDDVRLTWSDHDLVHWFADRSLHRDLVRRFEPGQPRPSIESLASVVSALVPIWREWNAAV